ncbi:Txe/YoeB family addiction module toxin, partial [Rheinheimera baltica]
MSSRLLSWTDESWSDYLYWQTQDKKTLKRINKLINDVKRSPFAGIGKPE